MISTTIFMEYQTKDLISSMYFFKTLFTFYFTVFSNPGEYQKVTYILMEHHKDGDFNLYFNQVSLWKLKEIFLVWFLLAHIPGKLEVKILGVLNLKDLQLIWHFIHWPFLDLYKIYFWFVYQCQNLVDACYFLLNKLNIDQNILIFSFIWAYCLPIPKFSPIHLISVSNSNFCPNDTKFW